jgi:hypothetical protein
MFGDRIKYMCRLYWRFTIGVNDRQQQSFSTLRVNRHPSSWTNPSCLELDWPSRTYQKGTRSYLPIAMVRLIPRAAERNPNELRGILLTSSTPTQPQRTRQGMATQSIVPSQLMTGSIGQKQWGTGQSASSTGPSDRSQISSSKVGNELFTT